MLVGKYYITKEDVNLLKRINVLQPGIDTSIASTITYLKKTLFCMHLADSLGVPITDSVLLWEKNRIDKNTHMPQRIDSIKKACGDSLTYLRLFVLPQLAQRWLYYHYYRMDNLHSAIRDSAKMVVSCCLQRAKEINILSALAGLALEQTATELRLPCFRYKVTEEQGFIVMKNPSLGISNGSCPSSTEKSTSIFAYYVQDRMEEYAVRTAKAFIHEILKKIKVGAIYPYPIDMGQSFWIIQYIDFYENAHYLVVIYIPKKNFFQWFYELTGM